MCYGLFKKGSKTEWKWIERSEGLRDWKGLVGSKTRKLGYGRKAVDILECRVAKMEQFWVIKVQYMVVRIEGGSR